GEPEGPVTRERVFARHVTDQASGNGEPGQDSTERRYRREQEACGSLHTLPYRQEPRHDGGPPSLYDGFCGGTYAPVVRQPRARCKSFVKSRASNLARKCQAPCGRSTKRTRAAVLSLSPSAKKPLRPSRPVKGITISTSLQTPEIQTLLEA